MTLFLSSERLSVFTKYTTYLRMLNIAHTGQEESMHDRIVWAEAFLQETLYNS